MSLGTQFYKKLIEVCNRTGVKPEDALLIMTLESGLNPAAYNKDGGASGLVQFMPKILEKTYKFNPRDHDNKQFKQLSGEEQLDYIERHFQNLSKLVGGNFKSAAQLYIANFFPVALTNQQIKQMNPSGIIVRKDPDKQIYKSVSLDFERKAYNSNKGLDYDKDGVITYGDIDAKMKNASRSKIYQNALNELNAAKQPSKEEGKIEMPTEFIELFNILKQGQNIYVYSKDFDDSFEFARILKYAIQENYDSECYICSDKSDVGLKVIGQYVDDNFVKEVKEEFDKNIINSVQFVNGMNFDYPEVTPNYEVMQLRKFLLKRNYGE
ncbi:MAG: transglycosylase SLT domain-containing protein [Chitinophagales bacterium]|nr:transglycosylase SLT domain-containing protein [Chitinophagales bacterium]